MSHGNQSIPEANKPVVGIIYSASIQDSSESKNLAYYLSCCLISRGFAKVKLVGLNQNGSPCDLRLEHADLHKGSISFLPPGKSSIKHAKSAAVSVDDCGDGVASKFGSSGSSQISLSHWNELEKCQVIIITVNSIDTIACSTKLASVLATSIYHVVVFSIQRGVKNGGILKDGWETLHRLCYLYSSWSRHTFFSPQATPSFRLRSVGTASNSKENNNVAVVEGQAAFACVPLLLESSPTTTDGPKTASTGSQGYCYACTVRTPQIMLERLSKEIAEVADGPVNLLETMGIEIQFRKTLTRKYFCTTTILFQCVIHIHLNSCIGSPSEDQYIVDNFHHFPFSFQRTRGEFYSTKLFMH